MEGVTLVKKNHYAVLTVDLPQSRNALSVPVVEYMNTLVDQVAEDPDLHCLVLTGGGEKSFIAGADIRKLVEMTPEESRYSIEAGHKLFSKLETMDIPVIASVNGYCLGGGLELAMACDIRICSANARFGLPEINIAMIPGWGGTLRLVRLIGESRAKNMLLRGKMDMEVVDIFGEIDALCCSIKSIMRKSATPFSWTVPNEKLFCKTDMHKDRRCCGMWARANVC